MITSLEALVKPLDVQADEIDYREMREPIGTEPAQSPDHGVRALMRAILRDAILCLQGEGPSVPADCRERVREEACSWVRSRDITYAFAFETICHVLGIDPASLRRHLLALAARTPIRRGKSNSVSDLTRKIRWVRMRGNAHTKVQARRSRARRAPSRSSAIAGT